jgi:hypothetical protein
MVSALTYESPVWLRCDSFDNANMHQSVKAVKHYFALECKYMVWCVHD